MKRFCLSVLVVCFALGCGDSVSKKGGGANNFNNGNNSGGNNGSNGSNSSNNGGANNGSANNGSANNGSANNGSFPLNNGAPNNGGSNNGNVNNGEFNNGIEPGLTCAELIDCLQTNDCQDETCAQMCFEQGTETSVQQALVLLGCVDDFCSDTDDVETCLVENCYTQAVTCFPQ